MEFVAALFEYRFLQFAVAASLLASISCGMVGTYVVVKRMGYLAGGIAHTVLGGIGVALFAGYPAMLGALVAAIVTALILGCVRLYWREQEDLLIGALWAVGMAVGVIFIAKTPGYQVDLMTYLFGNILLVSSAQLWLMLGLNVFLVVIILLYFKHFEAIAFDEEFARLRGSPVTALYLLLLCLIAVSVVLLVRIVGLILVIALLTLPAAIARQYVYNVAHMMVLSTGATAVFCLAGLALAYGPDLPAGATIVLVAAAAYLVSTVVAKWRAGF
ncbi:MAG: Manganese transport system membrane protein MntB [Gammaproteobacteria bacterium]|nr:Manganese transport system membrane protein MntB [Gammaproteobacteria bacterium]